MIDFLALGFLIWTVLAMAVDSHRETKREPPELSTVGKIAILPLTAGCKTMDLLGVVWNRVLYKQEVSSE